MNRCAHVHRQIVKVNLFVEAVTHLAAAWRRPCGGRERLSLMVYKDSR